MRKFKRLIQRISSLLLWTALITPMGCSKKSSSNNNNQGIENEVDGDSIEKSGLEMLNWNALGVASLPSILSNPSGANLVTEENSQCGKLGDLDLKRDATANFIRQILAIPKVKLCNGKPIESGKLYQFTDNTLGFNLGENMASLTICSEKNAAKMYRYTFGANDTFKVEASEPARPKEFETMPTSYRYASLSYFFDSETNSKFLNVTKRINPIPDQVDTSKAIGSETALSEFVLNFGTNREGSLETIDYWTENRNTEVRSSTTATRTKFYKTDGFFDILRSDSSNEKEDFRRIGFSNRNLITSALFLDAQIEQEWKATPYLKISDLDSNEEVDGKIEVFDFGKICEIEPEVVDCSSGMSEEEYTPPAEVKDCEGDTKESNLLTTSVGTAVYAVLSIGESSSLKIGDVIGLKVNHVPPGRPVANAIDRVEISLEAFELVDPSCEGISGGAESAIARSIADICFMAKTYPKLLRATTSGSGSVSISSFEGTGKVNLTIEP